ncbi:23S rRNA pseudouridine1911/1915/1917 synthase [Desulfonatronum thiosulfatophilum]|uniref:Dephospho-CoA kinase n=1 Tax=Desulfonatronum thiosulfatophilum TaxID=617002 RepID=A0A1G6AU09_9BACT|nr:dephospho-CoA kinase [Desulfonatronum thiosulfatophilum]SDB11848.1 23S rRNA pseudouridine1911/1915/1917 synthase [Desulfonatronum thiosulfatophilum]
MPQSDEKHADAPLTAIAPMEAQGQRLDQFWTNQLVEQEVARAKVQVWIKEGHARINGQACTRPSRRIVRGEHLELEVVVMKSDLQPENRELRILHLDEDLVVLNKPAGLVVHPAPGLAMGTLVHRLIHHFPELSELAGARPGIVHRLDKDTTGVMVVALNESTRLRLAASFADRQVDKTYLALVHGRPRATDFIDAPIGRHPTWKTRMAVLPKGGKPAQSEYRVLWSAAHDRFSLVQVHIFSGRTHQVRVHMQHVGHPLLGDASYCPNHFRAWQKDVPGLDKLVERPMLHAWKLGFAHPQTHEPLRFQLPPPKAMTRIMLVGSRTTQRVGLTGMPGCGKSLLLENLAAIGIPVWSADMAIAELYKPGQDGWELLRRRFGDRFIADRNSQVDKRALLQALRETPHLRHELEAMIHPLARHRLECFWEKHRGARVAVAEVPLLLETGWTSGFDLLVGLACDAHRRKAWLCEKRGWNEELLADVESWQWPEAKKLRACHLIVENPGTPDQLQRRAEALTGILRRLRRRKVRRLLSKINGLVNPKQ